jgi:hypothetical protein
LSLKKFQFTQAGTKNYLNFNMLSVSRSWHSIIDLKTANMPFMNLKRIKPNGRINAKIHTFECLLVEFKNVAVLNNYNSVSDGFQSLEHIDLILYLSVKKTIKCLP